MNETIGVLFDIDGLGGPSSYGTPCWRILMKHLDLKEMPGVGFYQGDVDVKASGRPYCFCIAISENAALTGRKGGEYFLRKLADAADAGLFPAGRRFVQGAAMSELVRSLIGSGRVDIEGRFRMSSNLGDLGDLRLVDNGREFGWTVIPDVDLLAVFALTYLAKTGTEGIPLSDKSRDTCELVLRDVGQRTTLAALSAAALPPDQHKLASDRIIRQVWKGVPEGAPAAGLSKGRITYVCKSPGQSLAELEAAGNQAETVVREFAKKFPGRLDGTPETKVVRGVATSISIDVYFKDHDDLTAMRKYGDALVVANGLSDRADAAAGKAAPRNQWWQFWK